VAVGVLEYVDDVLELDTAFGEDTADTVAGVVFGSLEPVGEDSSPASAVELAIGIDPAFGTPEIAVAVGVGFGSEHEPVLWFGWDANVGEPETSWTPVTSKELSLSGQVNAIWAVFAVGEIASRQRRAAKRQEAGHGRGSPTDLSNARQTSDGAVYPSGSGYFVQQPFQRRVEFLRRFVGARGDFGAQAVHHVEANRSAFGRLDGRFSSRADLHAVHAALRRTGWLRRLAAVGEMGRVGAVRAVDVRCAVDVHGEVLPVRERIELHEQGVVKRSRVSRMRA
jgi:hypothetical protein